MDHLQEVLRIIDGALKGNQPKVSAYAKQLARKLFEDGDSNSAQKIERALQQSSASELIASSLGSSTRMPVDSESRLMLADEVWIDPKDVNLILDQTVSQRVEEFIRFVRASDKLLASSVGLSPSMIIFGPPGVGKTELARYIAAQLKLPLIIGRTDSLISSFLGSTAKNIRLLFDHVRSRPCVLFLDELDSLAKLRDDQHEMGELKRVVVSLLQNLDALGNETVLLAATNHHHLLDPAIWRRFTYRLQLDVPSREARFAIIKLFLREYVIDDDLPALASISQGLSGADLKSLCENAVRLAIVNDQSKVTTAEVIKGIIRNRFGEQFSFDLQSSTHLKQVHELNPEAFTMKRLAAIFETSESTICRRFKSTEDEKNA